jgi:hypothetical protein
MDRILITINEDETDLNISSSDYTGDKLPTVTPKQRSFADTVNKQNRDDKALREKILRDKIAKLQEELYDTEHALDYNAQDPYGGRTPSQQKPVPPMTTAFSSHHSTSPTNPRRCLSSCPTAVGSTRKTKGNTRSRWFFETKKSIIEEKNRAITTYLRHQHVRPHRSLREDLWPNCI